MAARDRPLFVIGAVGNRRRRVRGRRDVKEDEGGRATHGTVDRPGVCRYEGMTAGRVWTAGGVHGRSSVGVNREIIAYFRQCVRRTMMVRVRRITRGPGGTVLLTRGSVSRRESESFVAR